MKFLIYSFFKTYCDLTKIGIVCFVLFIAFFSYILSLDYWDQLSFDTLIVFLTGLYFICSGAFILNQAQEWRLDQKMKRTQNRPIPCKIISPFQGCIMAFGFIFFGCALLFLLKPLTAGLAFLTVVLYNGLYTLYWKKYLKYGAVLGALPGAFPSLIGYSLGDQNLFDSECLYLFLLLFVWQMPHFWSLAIKYKKDYERAGLPILPVLDGSERTLYHIGFYILAYVGLALISPLFLTVGLMYVFFLLPLTVILLYRFYEYFYNPLPMDCVFSLG